MIKIKLSKIIASALIAVSVFALNPTGANAAWKKDSTGWWYTEGNSWATGWRVIGGKSYYFESDGYMVTQFKRFYDDTYYYFDPIQGNVFTGWKKHDGVWYYFSKEAEGTKRIGFMRTGWFYDNGRWYYFSDIRNDYGHMKTGLIGDDRGNYYYLDESDTSNIGAMKTGWQKVNDNWYYFNTSADDGVDGRMEKGWKKIKGTWYYLSLSDGKMAANTWVNGYYLNSEGAWIPGGNNSGVLTFADKNLEKVIRNKIDKPIGTLYKSDVERITELTIWDNTIKEINLSGIENLKNLESLDVLHTKISDMNTLKKLTKLKHLGLMNCGIKDISPLKELTNLEWLSLEFNGSIQDISALEGLTKLQYLDLMYNEISDLSPLRGLTNLQRLEINGNLIDAEEVEALEEALPNCDIR